jgi:hypothetical protein
MLGKNWIFRGKSLSVEKMYEKLAPGWVNIHTYCSHT